MGINEQKRSVPNIPTSHGFMEFCFLRWQFGTLDVGVTYDPTERGDKYFENDYQRLIVALDSLAEIHP